MKFSGLQNIYKRIQYSKAKLRLIYDFLQEKKKNLTKPTNPGKYFVNCFQRKKYWIMIGPDLDMARFSWVVEGVLLVSRKII